MKTYRQKIKNKNGQSGNMVLALFAAVAMVGTIGAGTTMVMRGPLKVMSDVNQRAITESQILLSSKMVMLDTENLTTADCDSDKLNEPREWSDASGAGPDGVAGSDGGGYIPDSIGISKQDTWGTRYGYCVWDHGALTDDAACGGAGQRRLEGTNSIQYPVVAIISAGPNATFETTCLDFSTADSVTADGILDIAGGESHLVNQGGDDMVIVYSYAEASKDNPSLWNLELDANGNVVSSITDPDIDDVEFTGSNTAFGGNLALTGTLGLDIPDEVALPTCDASVEGQIRRNMSGATPALEICEDTGGAVYAWVPLSTGGGAGSSSSSTANDPGPGCAPTAESMSVVDSYFHNTNLAGVDNVKVKGDYAFAVANNSIVSFDISNPYNIVELDIIVNATTMDDPVDLALQGNYAYVAAKTSDTITIIDITDPANMVEKDSYTSANMGRTYGIKVRGDYAYVTEAVNDGIISFDISDPDNIVELDNVFNGSTIGYTESIAIQGDYAYLAGVTQDSLTVIDISDPTNMVEKGTVSSTASIERAFGLDVKGDYAYVASLDYDDFAVIDVSNPDGPTIRGTLTGLSNATSSPYIKLSGNYVFIVSRDKDAITIIDISDPDNPIEVGSKVFDPAILDYPIGLDIKDNYLYVVGGNSKTLTIIDVCAQGIQGQVTVNQTADGGSTLGSVGWAQTLASDSSGDETGIAFVVDPLASRSSVPQASIVAKRSWTPSDMVFKTRDSNATVDGSTYFAYDSRLGVDLTTGVDSWKYGSTFTTLQIGVHDPFNWNSVVYEHGLLVTTNTAGTDQMAYFGFEVTDNATGTVMFSKDLKIKKTNSTGSQLDEYMRFESDKTTTFFW